jgi:hypothetical protein
MLFLLQNAQNSKYMSKCLFQKREPRVIRKWTRANSIGRRLDLIMEGENVDPNRTRLKNFVV